MSGKILIVDDAEANRKILRALLERDYYTIIEAEDGVEAIEVTNKENPDLILLDVMMPNMNGFQTCSKLKENPKTNNIPVIMVTSSESVREKQEGLEAGADDFLPKPMDQNVLLARVRNLLRVKTLLDELNLRAETARDLGLQDSLIPRIKISNVRVLLVASSFKLATNWARQLEPLGGFDIAYADGECEAIKRAKSEKFDAMIVAEHLIEDGIGMRLIARLRADWSNRDLTIIFVAQSNHKAGLRALEFGANDYVVEPFDTSELIARLRTQSKRIALAKQLREQFNKQLRLSVIDPLTELHNRRYFDDYMPKLLSRASRDQIEIALMMVDLDHFKHLNDTYGHDFGDEVLIEFSRRVRENMRAADLIIRFGGEEFLILAPGVSREEANTISERLRKLIAQTPFVTTSGEKVTVTASIGVTMVRPGEDQIPTLIKRADTALYQAKKCGRDQVVFNAA